MRPNRSFPFNAFWPELRSALTPSPACPTARSEAEIVELLGEHSSAAAWVACLTRLQLGRLNVSERDAAEDIFDTPHSTFADYLATPSRMPLAVRLKLRTWLKEQFAQIDPDVPDAFIASSQYPPKFEWNDKSLNHTVTWKKYQRYFLDRRRTMNQGGHVGVFCDPLPYIVLNKELRAPLLAALRKHDPDTYKRFAGTPQKVFNAAQRWIIELALGYKPVLPFDERAVQVDESDPDVPLAVFHTVPARAYQVSLVMSAESIRTLLGIGNPGHWLVDLYDQNQRESLVEWVDDFLRVNRMRLHVIGWPTLDPVDARALGGVPPAPKQPSIITQVTTDRGAVACSSWFHHPRNYYDKVYRDEMGSRRTRAAAIRAVSTPNAAVGENQFRKVCEGLGWATWKQKRDKQVKAGQVRHLIRDLP